MRLFHAVRQVTFFIHIKEDRPNKTHLSVPFGLKDPADLIPRQNTCLGFLILAR